MASDVSDDLGFTINQMGSPDLDTVKGCSGVNEKRPDGCYGCCYAWRVYRAYGRSFKPVARYVKSEAQINGIVNAIRKNPLQFYRVGVMGVPSEYWGHTINVLDQFRITGKRPVVITKHWKVLSDDDISALIRLRAVMHTSVSALDTPSE